MSSPVNPEKVLEGKDLQLLFRLWEEKHTQPGFDPVPVLKRLSEVFEEETEVYMRKDPDPFDDRHPSRTDPDCEFGRSLKLLFRRDNFMTKLVNDYLRDNYFTRQNIPKSSLELNIVACRLILVIMPGLETSAVFQTEYDNLINRIYNWAEDSIEPLQTYATGLLAAAMDITDIAVTFREHNTRLVPKMLKRLHMLQALSKSREKDANDSQNHNSKNEKGYPLWMGGSAPSSPAKIDENVLPPNGLVKFPSSSNLSTLLENENSMDVSSQKITNKYLIPIYPPTTATSQMNILKYLATMGEYQEFLGQVFENGAMQIIFGYIENIDPRDTCLAFEALKYLASLLCHKKFALEFISRGGLALLLKVPRPSVASTGVSITFYYLAYCEDAMERICAMPKKAITELVEYGLWLLGRSHDSGKCHATMFFGLCFQFKIILDEFDAQDGLRKLYNVISILPILSAEDTPQLNDDEETAARTLVKHVCVALKKYLESHLFFKYHQFLRHQCPLSDTIQLPAKSTKATLEQVSEQVRTLQENMPVRMHWPPVDQLLRLGGVGLLLRIIALTYDWNSSGRAETVRSALDVLSICCIIPRVYNSFCDSMELPEGFLPGSSAGINAILGAAVGEIVTDAEVQKSALAVLVHCVCAPLNRPIVAVRYGSARRKMPPQKLGEELIEKVWESVCSNNGIIVLLQLMQTKSPITDADCIRGMACKALAGLARSDRVRQIVGKLPLFASGQIQHLMRDPILQEKRAEHVLFQKYGLELLERVLGKAKSANSQFDASLSTLHKANVVAQTRIQFNEHQLNQLIHDHLVSKGMVGAATALKKEAGLNVPPPTKSFHHSPLDYKVVTTNAISRSRIRARTQELNSALNAAINEPAPNSLANGGLQAVDSPEELQLTSQSITPIKLIKKTAAVNNLATPSTVAHSPAQRSLQKQITSNEGFAGLSNVPRDYQNSNNVTLTTIVTEYLTNQHALCNNPMTTCPQFDLFKPHKCPDPKANRGVGLEHNLTARLFKAQLGYKTMALDRRFVHTQFCLSKTIRQQDFNELQFTCCDFLPCNNLMIAGTYHGDAKVYNINEGTEEFSTNCHGSFLEYVKSSRDGSLALTSCSWRSPLSCLWSISNKEFVLKKEFDDEYYCEFSNLSNDRILGTKTEAAVIFDLHTGAKIASYIPTISNQYTKNKATFCPTDELILSDGVLWDVRSATQIHKFDKLNQTLSGVFHPNGLEIVSNTEVWDLRTFHLLRTVPVLDQCLIKFSSLNVIYGINLDLDTRVDFETANSYDSSFKVLDSFDYSSISTIDVKRNIYDISVNKYGSQIALVENQVAYESLQESYIRIYSVGVRKNDEQEEEEEDELDTDENSGSESDSSHVPVFQVDLDLQPAGRRRNRRRNNANENFEEEIIEFLESTSSENEGEDEGDDAAENANDEDDSDSESLLSPNPSSSSDASTTDDEVDIEMD